MTLVSALNGTFAYVLCGALSCCDFHAVVCRMVKLVTNLKVIREVVIKKGMGATHTPVVVMLRSTHFTT